jgi:hypothetical protein
VPRPIVAVKVTREMGQVVPQGDGGQDGGRVDGRDGPGLQRGALSSREEVIIVVREEVDGG